VLDQLFKLRTRRAKPSSPKPRSRPRVRARVARLVFRARRRLRAREAQPHILRAKNDLYQEISWYVPENSGTYCLPIQNAWYTGTLVQKMLVPGAAGLVGLSS